MVDDEEGGEAGRAEHGCDGLCGKKRKGEHGRVRGREGGRGLTLM